MHAARIKWVFLQVMSRKQHLFELSQAWSQMRDHTQSILTSLTEYYNKCHTHQARPPHMRARAPLAEFVTIQKACETKHDDMRLINNRYR